MKARVKYNNEIIDVIQVGTKTHLFDLNNVEFLNNPQDYWTRLEHTYAGMAMQSLIMTSTHNFGTSEQIAMWANEYAIALVKELKEEK